MFWAEDPRPIPGRRPRSHLKHPPAHPQDTISIIQETQSQHGIAGNSLLNFCVSDGATLVATRYTSSPDEEPASLYYAEGCSYDRSKEGVEESGIASAAAAASDPGGQRDSGTANASSKAVAGGRMGHFQE